MRELEDELQNPTGISTVTTPKLSISGVLLSKECGILYEVTNSEGLRCVICSPDRIGDVESCHRSRTFFRKVTTCACHLNTPPIHRH
jgi:hypothetical protein